MKVFFDHQIFSMQNEGGISRYFAELIRELRSRGVRTTVGAVISGNRYLDRSLWSGLRYPAQGTPARLVARAQKVANRVSTIGSLFGKRFDIIHPTYFDPFFMYGVGRVPVVVTVYDLIHDIFPDDFPGGDLFRAKMKRTVLAAKAVIAISENTKKDLLRFYPIPEHKVHVVPLATSMVPPRGAVPRGRGDRRYFLFVGKRDGYKNFRTALRAFGTISVSFPMLDLVATGGGVFSEEESRLVDMMGLRNRVQFEFADDKRLLELYSHAEGLLYISRYEGFGLPILEAFACRCPVITSNVSSMPEVAGNAGLYVEPDDSDSVAQAMRRIMEESELRNSLIALGLMRLSEFSWKRCADLTAQVYNHVLS